MKVRSIVVPTMADWGLQPEENGGKASLLSTDSLGEGVVVKCSVV